MRNYDLSECASVLCPVENFYMNFYTFIRVSTTELLLEFYTIWVL